MAMVVNFQSVVQGFLLQFAFSNRLSCCLALAACMSEFFPVHVTLHIVLHIMGSKIQLFAMCTWQCKANLHDYMCC